MVHLGDICKINGAEIEPVWVVTGGSPCQDLSIAGKRAGLAGARSGLFMEQVRIVKEMREADKRNGRTGNMVRPRFLVWENVVGAYSSNRGRDFHAVLEEIARIAEPGFSLSGLPDKQKWTKAGAIDGDGWSIAWRTHDAKDWGKTIRDSRTGNVIRLGTPQRRRRISVVADFGGESAAQIQFDCESVSGHPAESGAAGEGSAEAAESGFNPAVGDCMTAWDCQSKRIFNINGKAPTLQGGVGGGVNNPAIFVAIPINDKATRWKGGGESRNHDGSGNGLGIGKEGDPSPTLTAGDRHGVMCMNPWDAQSARVYDQEGVWHSLNANEKGGMARDSVLCAAFKLGNSEQARSIGYQEELSPTLNAECGGNKPAVMCLNDQGGNVMGVSHDVSGTLREQEHGHQPTILDMSHACDVIRECGEQVPALQARMGTGGNQVPLTFQMNGFGDYRAAEVASSCKQRDFKDGTDLVCSSVDCRNFREGGEVNGTLQAKESGGQSLNLNNTVRQNMVVRRLTPMECERLQGFPDHWTDIGEWTDGNGKRHKPSDSPRYKALGNSIALPFWDWMLRRMARYLPECATLGSLFDGIGGFPLIWERIHGKGTARWASEIEPFPIAVTKKWFGEE